MSDFKETFSLILVVVGILALIVLLSRSSCASGEVYQHHGRGCRCGCQQGIIGVKDGIIGVKDGIIGVKDGIIGVKDGIIGVKDGFSSSKVPCKSGTRDNYPANNTTCADDALHGGDYNLAMQNCALEPDVQESHSKWIEDLAHKTSTASKDTVRDDPNDINPWVGLRRPKYKTRAQPLADARTISSDIPCEMLDMSTSYCIG